MKHEAHACAPCGAVEEVRPPLSLSHTLLSCAVQCLLIIVVKCAIDLLCLFLSLSLVLPQCISVLKSRDLRSLGQ